jgi:hypothetical protein
METGAGAEGDQRTFIPCDSRTMAFYFQLCSPLECSNPCLPLGQRSPPPPRTFTELFASMPDAFNGAYQGLFEPVRPTPQMVAAAVQMYVCHLFPSEQVPSVWLYQARDTGRIKTMVVLFAVQGLPGPVADPWKGTVIAFASDIYYGQVAPIRVPTALCENTTAVRAPTIATMTAEVAAACPEYQRAVYARPGPSGRDHHSRPERR